MERSVGKGVRVAITGATGFLGSHITERLLKQGYAVHALARDGTKARSLRNKVAKVVLGDIRDAETVAELVKDCDIAIHTVSNFRTASGSPQSYWQVNVGGTVNTLEVARAAGVKPRLP